MKSKKKWIFITIGILILAFVLAKMFNESRNPSLKQCDGGPYFTAAPVDLEYIDYLVPLGNLNPPGHTFPTDHIYIIFPESAEYIPVYAPGDMKITEIQSADNEKWRDKPYNDFHVTFKVCDKIQGQYIHIDVLSETLQKAFEKSIEKDCKKYIESQKFGNCQARVNIDILAGEQIGKVGHEDHHGFDLGVYDKTKDPWTFANMKRFSGDRDNYLYTQCPIDYYETVLKEKFMSIFSGGDGDLKRTIEPVCGTIGQDVPGTAQGLWFIKNTDPKTWEYEQDHLALVHDNYNPALGAISIGLSLERLGIPSEEYEFEPQHTGQVNKDFNEVTPDGQIYCYGQHGDTIAKVQGSLVLSYTPKSKP